MYVSLAEDTPFANTTVIVIYLHHHPSTFCRYLPTSIDQKSLAPPRPHISMSMERSLPPPPMAAIYRSSYIFSKGLTEEKNAERGKQGDNKERRKIFCTVATSKPCSTPHRPAWRGCSQWPSPPARTGRGTTLRYVQSTYIFKVPSFFPLRTDEPCGSNKLLAFPLCSCPLPFPR